MVTKRLVAKAARRVRRMVEQAVMFFLAIFLGMVAAGAAVMPLKHAVAVHHLFGAAVAVIVLAAMIAAVVWLKAYSFTSRDLGKYPRLGLVANVLLVSLSCTYAFAALSVTTYKLGWTSYTLDATRQVPAEVAYEQVLEGAIVDTYAWHLVDAVPVVKLWELWDTKPPAQASAFGSRLLLLVFRGLLLAQMVALLTKEIKWDFRGQLQVATKATDDRADREQALDHAIEVADSSSHLVYRIDARLAKAEYLQGIGNGSDARLMLDEAKTLIDIQATLQDLERRRRRFEDLRAAVSPTNALTSGAGSAST